MIAGRKPITVARDMYTSLRGTGISWPNSVSLGGLLHIPVGQMSEMQEDAVTLQCAAGPKNSLDEY